MRMAMLAAMVVIGLGCGGHTSDLPSPGTGGTGGSGGSAAGGTGGSSPAPTTGGTGGSSTPDAAPTADAEPAATPDSAVPSMEVGGMGMMAQPDAAPPSLDTAPPAPDAGKLDAPPAAACTRGSTTGCLAGQWCSQATGTCLTAMTAMRWDFSHQCAAAGTIGIRLFDDVNGGAWPGNDVYTLPTGAQQGVTINCIAGARICFGARGSVSAGFWGADVDGSKACTDCCHTCGGGLVPVQRLICN